MRHLIVITGLLLCTQVHADPIKVGNTHYKPTDYSRNHALSNGGASDNAPGSATKSALDQLLSKRGLISNSVEAAANKDGVGDWLASHEQPQASLPTSIAPNQTNNSSRVADRFATLVVDAISHIGIPYKFGGNGIESGGFDCSGFVKAIYLEALGTALPRRSEEQAAATQRITKTDLRPGDLVFFNTTRRPNSHVGIYVGDDKFVHAPRTGARIRIESLSSNYWTKRFNGARRVDVAHNNTDTSQSAALAGTY